MRDPIEQPTQVRNIGDVRETLIEMDLVKRVIDMMANRIKVLHHRALVPKTI